MKISRQLTSSPLTSFVHPLINEQVISFYKISTTMASSLLTLKKKKSLVLRARFSKVPIINGPVKLLFFYIQDRGFNSFKDKLIKLRVSENPLIYFFWLVMPMKLASTRNLVSRSLADEVVFGFVNKKSGYEIGRLDASLDKTVC